MTDKIDILWTAVPGRVVGATVTLKLVPTFQPSSDPNGIAVGVLEDWPQTILGDGNTPALSFSLLINGHVVNANPGNPYVLKPTTSPSSPAWDEIIWRRKEKGARSLKITSRALSRDANACVTTSHLHMAGSLLREAYGTVASNFFANVSTAASYGKVSLQKAQQLEWAYQRDDYLGPLKWQDKNLDGESHVAPWTSPRDPYGPNAPDPEIDGTPLAGSPALDERYKRNLARLNHGGEFGLHPFVWDRIKYFTHNTLPKMKRDHAPHESLFGGVFLQHALFHMRAPDRNPGVRRAQPSTTFRADASTNGATPSILSDPDVLARITLARNYPVLLEPLGLVLTFELPASIFDGLEGDSTLSIHVNNADFQQSTFSTTAIVVNRTAAVNPTTGASVRKLTSIDVQVYDSSSYPCKGGFLDLGNCPADTDEAGSNFVISTIDLDGLALKLIQLAANLGNVESARALLPARTQAQAEFSGYQNKVMNALAREHYPAAVDMLDPNGARFFNFTAPNHRAWTYKTLHLNNGAAHGGEVVAHGRAIWSGERPSPSNGGFNGRTE